MGNKQSNNPHRRHSQSARKKSRRRKKARESIESDGLNYYINMTQGERENEKNEEDKKTVCQGQFSPESSLSSKPTVKMRNVKKDVEGEEVEEGTGEREEDTGEDNIDEADKAWDPIGTDDIFGRDFKDSDESGTIKKSPAMVQRKNRNNLRLVMPLLNNEKLEKLPKSNEDPRITDDGWVGEDDLLAYREAMTAGGSPTVYQDQESLLEHSVETGVSGDEEHLVIQGLVEKYRKYKHDEFERNFLKYSQEEEEEHEFIQRMTGNYARLKEEKDKRRSLQECFDDKQKKVSQQKEHEAIQQMIEIAQNVQREKETQEKIISMSSQPEHTKMRTLVHTLKKIQQESVTHTKGGVWMDPMDKDREKQQVLSDEKVKNIFHNQVIGREVKARNIGSCNITETNKSADGETFGPSQRNVSEDAKPVRQESRERHKSLQECIKQDRQSTTAESDSDIPFIDDLQFTDYYQIGDIRNGHRVISKPSGRKKRSRSSSAEINEPQYRDDNEKQENKSRKSVRSDKRHPRTRSCVEIKHVLESKETTVNSSVKSNGSLTRKQVLVKSVNTQTSQEDLMKAPVPEIEYKKETRGRRSRGTSPDTALVKHHDRAESDESSPARVIGKVSASTETSEPWRNEKGVKHGKRQTKDQLVGEDRQMKFDTRNKSNANDMVNRDRLLDEKEPEEFGMYKEQSDSEAFSGEFLQKSAPISVSEISKRGRNFAGDREASQNCLQNSYEMKYNMIKEKYGHDKDPYLIKHQPTPTNIGVHREDQQTSLQSDSSFSDDSDTPPPEKSTPVKQRKQASPFSQEGKRFATLSSSIEYDIDVNITGLARGPEEIHTLPKTKARVRKQENSNKSIQLSASDDFPVEDWYHKKHMPPPYATLNNRSSSRSSSGKISGSTSQIPTHLDEGRKSVSQIYRKGATMSLDRSLGKVKYPDPDVAHEAISDFHLRQVQVTIINDKVISNPMKVNIKTARAASVDSVMLHTKPDYLSILSTEDLSLPPPTRHSVVRDAFTLRRHSLGPASLKTPQGLTQLPVSSSVPDDEDFWENRKITLMDVNIFQMLFGAQNFDVIKFATYRTACKLRFIQKKTNLYLVDIWNVIEAFRENGLNSFEAQAEVNVARLESLLTTVYYHLNKRLPTTSQINTEYSLGLLMNWLLSAYDPQGNGRIRVLSIKVALSTLCAGKLMDKLRYIFTQISDSNGYMVRSKFDEYLKEVLALPTAVFEGPSFGYNETAARACFGDKTKVSVNDFLDTLMSDPGPQCLMWLPILHRMAQVENVFHPVQCEGCHRESFMGFRYKCQRCYNYHLCQDCFWRGRSSGNHTSDHEVKEYSSYKSPAKQFGHSLRKSFRCVPASRSNHRIPRFPEQEQTLDLSHIVPPTPVPSHNGFPETHSRSHSIDMSSLDTSSATQSPSKMHGSIDSSRVDEEHRLIARYAARLAADANEASRSPTELNFSLDSNRAQRELIAQLEAKNRDILREIQRLRLEQEQAAKASPDPQQPRNPTLLAELRLLRQRRDELEGRMSALQESRRELMVQLEGLMKLLKSQGSPRSTPNSSPRSRTAHSPPTAMVRGSTPSTPGDSLVSVGGDVRQAFGHQGNPAAGMNVRSLRNDLLVAADSVTNAMSSLVKELNSEASGSDDEDDDDDDDDGFNGKRKDKSSSHTVDEMTAWREEMQQRLQQESEFIAQLRARRDSGQKESNGRYIPGADGTGTYTDGDESYVKTDDESYMRTDEEDAELYDRDPKELFLQPRYLTDEESYLETDQESYIRTDDEDGGGTDWEETMRRWVNR